MNLKPIFAIIAALIFSAYVAGFIWLLVNAESALFKLLAFAVMAAVAMICVILLGLIAAMFEASDWKYKKHEK